MNKQEIDRTWVDFLPIFSAKILPIYQRHEADFDLIGFHGRRHLTRSVILAEMMTRFYVVQGEELDFEGIRLAVSFHDSGREANGRDYWEAESAENCYEYLLEMGKGKDYAKNISKTILQKKHDIKNRLSQIIYDADVLEIMRLFVDSENGDQKFRTSELFFLGNNELHSTFSKDLLALQKPFIKEVWLFIAETEHARLILENEEYLPAYLAVIQNNREKYPLMNQFLENL